MGLSITEYHKMVGDAAGSRMFSLDDDRIGGDWHDNVVADGEGPQGAYEANFFKRSVADAIQDLPEREQMVMALYYDEELTLKEVGAVLELSESRVCQIHGQALIRLRSRLQNWSSDDNDDEMA